MHSRISNPCIRICLLKSDPSLSALRYTLLSDWLSCTTLAAFWKTSLTSHVTARTVCMHMCKQTKQANLLVLSRTFSKRLTCADKRRRCPPSTSVTCRVKGLSVTSLMTCCMCQLSHLSHARPGWVWPPAFRCTWTDIFTMLSMSIVADHIPAGLYIPDDLV